MDNPVYIVHENSSFGHVVGVFAINLLILIVLCCGSGCLCFFCINKITDSDDSGIIISKKKPKFEMTKWEPPCIADVNNFKHELNPKLNGIPKEDKNINDKKDTNTSIIANNSANSKPTIPLIEVVIKNETQESNASDEQDISETKEDIYDVESKEQCKDKDKIKKPNNLPVKS
jgi:hypothetical protein